MHHCPHCTFSTSDPVKISNHIELDHPEQNREQNRELPGAIRLRERIRALRESKSVSDSNDDWGLGISLRAVPQGDYDTIGGFYTLPRNRQLDVRIAGLLFGHRVVAYDWPCGRDCECGIYSASYQHKPQHFMADHMADHYGTPDAVYSYHIMNDGSVDEDGWPPDAEGSARVTVVPFYATDPAESKRVRERMAELGYWFRMQGPFLPDQPRGFYAGFTPHGVTGWNGVPDHWTTGDTEEMAVALAALEAMAQDRP